MLQHFQFEVFGNLRNKIYFHGKLIGKILVKFISANKLYR
ncbi:hypothetical protein HMPREF9220_0208 [Dialister micraerophilus UPII 345-E]|uniref:Uncharacterized protein n=1 Tax=Dialister micraerophilus UPII 345-E TaxID=910314 RepID=E4LAE5_9FIRM|nr:hypothetical protein HMPREF9220_0208 [Dialister micraerophilus UPII 345-E]